MAAKSNAERQAAFRSRRARDSRAVQLWLGEPEKLALSLLARHWGVGQSEVVARLLREADRAVVEGLDDGALEEYFR